MFMHRVGMKTSNIVHSKKPQAIEGFTLVEVLISMIILTFGLLALGQMNFIAMGSSSLARSKSSAAVVGQDKLEFLADLFRQNASHSDLALGDHDPEQVQISNSDGSAQNRYSIAWNISDVPDPRAGARLKARVVRVTVTPVGSGTIVNRKAFLNKAIDISTVIAP
jgi:type II secretory pathway pseudopilin PulG